MYICNTFKVILTHFMQAPSLLFHVVVHQREDWNRIILIELVLFEFGLLRTRL